LSVSTIQRFNEGIYFIFRLARPGRLIAEVEKLDHHRNWIIQAMLLVSWADDAWDRTYIFQDNLSYRTITSELAGHIQ